MKEKLMEFIIKCNLQGPWRTSCSPLEGHFFSNGWAHTTTPFYPK